MIQVAKTSLTAAQIKALFGTPITLLAAPASGDVNNIIGITEDFTYVAPAYGTTAKLRYGYNVSLNASFAQSANNVLFSGGSSIMPAQKTSALTPFSTNAAFKVDVGINPIAGNGTMNIYVIYETVTVNI